jgi:hypothetical protein
VIRCYCPTYGYETILIQMRQVFFVSSYVTRVWMSYRKACKGEKNSEGDQHICCAYGIGQQESLISGRSAISKCIAVKQMLRINNYPANVENMVSS